ncbi:MAG TPA: hypothetical protein VF291_03490, partial [Burkholderiaceae bacterium]
SLTLAASSSGTQLKVSDDGYGVFGRLQPGRRDLHIELADGTVLYRRITASAASGDAETLTLDAALPAAIAPGAVRQINWLTLCSLASDSVKIDHQTDAAGVAVAALSWQAVLE